MLILAFPLDPFTMTQPSSESTSALTPQANRFAHQQFTVKRPFLSFLGRKYYVYAPDGSLVLFLKHPVMKLRGEFTIYTDESEKTPLLTVRARKIVSLNMAHDVFDPATGDKTGSIRSRGMKSIIRDTWDILDANDQVIGIMEEEGFALLRRFFKFLPGRHKIELDGQRVATFQQKFRFFTKEAVLDLSPGGDKLDPRFGVACALLALMKESAREDAG